MASRLMNGTFSYGTNLVLPFALNIGDLFDKFGCKTAPAIGRILS
ncbi:MAG: hypothetical protein U1E92_00350 [Moraxella osloensis]